MQPMTGCMAYQLCNRMQSCKKAMEIEKTKKVILEIIINACIINVGGDFIDSICRSRKGV